MEEWRRRSRGGEWRRGGVEEEWGVEEEGEWRRRGSGGGGGGVEEEGEWRRRGSGGGGGGVEEEGEWRRGVKNNNLLSQNTHNHTHREWGRGSQGCTTRSQTLPLHHNCHEALSSPSHPTPHPTFTQDQGHSLPSGPPPHHLLHIRGMRSSAVCLMSTVIIPQSTFVQADPMVTSVTHWSL